VKAVQKNGKHDKEKWPYLRVLDLANALRSRLLAKGILLIPDDVERWSESFQSDRDGRRWTEAGVQTQFTITDGKQSLTFASYGVGQDSEGCAMSKAQTMALKAWLKRIGLIFGEYDDQEKGVSEPEATPRERLALANFQERAWHSAVEKSGKTSTQIESFLRQKFNIAPNEIASLSPREFEEKAMPWLLTNGDLEETLELSKKAAKKRSVASISEGTA